jgi:hypothetical protein
MPLSESTRNLLIELYRVDARDRSKFVTDFAIQGIRSLILANGGALFGLVTLSSAGENPALLRLLVVPALLFTAGFACGIGTTLLAYLSQLNISRGERETAVVWQKTLTDPDYVPALPEDLIIRGRRFQIASLVAGVASMLCFVVGAVICVFKLGYG